MPYKSSATRSLNDKKRGFKIPKKSAKLANFLGILTGDGYIGCYGYNHVIEVIGNSEEDKEFLLEHVIGLFKKLFSIEPKKYFRKYENTLVIRANSKGIYHFLRDQNFPDGKKKRLVIPAWIRGSNLNMQEFVKGLFDTDGSLCLKKNHGKYEFYPVINISLKERHILSEIKQWISEHDITSYIGKNNEIDKRTMKRYPRFYIQISGYKNTFKWIKLVGSNNSKHIKKIEKIKMGQAGFEPAMP
ncbi:MAG: LAGLIDADG family homing endonuclease [Nanoarchaeota archaeon]